MKKLEVVSTVRVPHPAPVDIAATMPKFAMMGCVVKSTVWRFGAVVELGMNPHHARQPVTGDDPWDVQLVVLPLEGSATPSKIIKYRAVVAVCHVTAMVSNVVPLNTWEPSAEVEFCVRVGTN